MTCLCRACWPLINEWGYSRVPVFEDNLDKITGILYIKDLLPHINDSSFSWHRVIKPAFFVPENIKKSTTCSVIPGETHPYGSCG